MNKKTIKDIDIQNKRVLVRVDFNVPMDNGKITDDNRIREAIPTIKYLLDGGASVILCSHLGRPDGKKVKELTLYPCAKRLQQLMGQPVTMADDCIGRKTQTLCKNLKPGQIVLLENLRFHKEEEECDEEFSKKLASLADVFVMDAFGTAHRKHASTYGVTKYLPSAIGLLVQKELEMISDNLKDPQHPFVLILGGAKVKDKIKMIENLVSKVDYMLVGGAMSYAFLKAKGYNTGKYQVDDQTLKIAQEVIERCDKAQVNLLLPIDHLVTDNFKSPTVIRSCDSPNILDRYDGADIGKKTIKMFKHVIKQAKTVLWNGPMGVFENKLFDDGTKAIAKALAKNKGLTIIGGGDTASAVISYKLAHKMTHVSTGGGASLKLFEGSSLVAIDAIEDK